MEEGGPAARSELGGGAAYPAVETAITCVPAGATTYPSVAAGVLNCRAEPRPVE